MRIAELADLAGVTVRTIRYYHQAGILPEPPRLSNGYRDYTVDDLVTVLKIVELTESGLSLSQAATVAAGSTDSPDDVLDDADRALAAKISVLTEQRKRLAEARAGGHVGLSREAAALSVSPDDLPAAILLAHLYRDNPQLPLLATMLSAPEMRESLESIQKRFDALDEHSTDDELVNLTADIHDVMADFTDGLPALTEEQNQLILALTEGKLNNRQRRFFEGQ